MGWIEKTEEDSWFYQPSSSFSQNSSFHLADQVGILTPLRPALASDFNTIADKPSQIRCCNHNS